MVLLLRNTSLAARLSPKLPQRPTVNQNALLSRLHDGTSVIAHGSYGMPAPLYIVHRSLLLTFLQAFMSSWPCYSSCFAGTMPPGSSLRVCFQGAAAHTLRPSTLLALENNAKRSHWEYDVLMMWPTS